MPKIYSSDFRNCVLDNYDRGVSRLDILATFGIGQRTLYNWLSSRTKGCNIRSEYKKVRKIDTNKLLSVIESHNDLTLEELAEKFSCSKVAIWKRCKKLGITRKKNYAISGKKSEKA